MRKYYIASRKKRNTLHKVKRRKANWIGRILRKNCFLKTFIEGNIERTGRWRRRGKQVSDDPKQKRRYL